MNIYVYVIPHEKQRYPTVGDWYFTEYSGRNLNIFVSDMKNDKYHYLVAFHEQIEAMLCFENDISEEAVTKFDSLFEKEREQGLHTLEAEPGDDPRAPYFEYHRIATELERFMAQKLGVNWEEYEKAIYNL